MKELSDLSVNIAPEAYLSSPCLASKESTRQSPIQAQNTQWHLSMHLTSGLLDCTV